MKITSDQLAALQLTQKNTARNSPGDGFAQALAQELDTSSAIQAGTTQTSPVVRLDQALQAAMLCNPTEQNVMDKMQDLLSKWENYSRIIGGQEGNLREGYSLLAGIRNDLQEVKDDLARIPAPGQGLTAMVEELDVLTTTEEFKFNRGDYLN